MGISKTRQMLVDVARQLFAKDGKNNVTMNDIATASQKGRRTLYTYFKNKNAIYLAVIEKEISLLQEKLQTVLDKNVPPDQKKIEYLFVHLEAAKEALTRNGSLRADFFKDIYEVEHARQRVDLWETDRLTEI
ncbi:MAG: TetR/AcrR family transcriptional regulator, partial [Paludibacteraceae bacterium]|nr:TetR/AcrR family transcriptional regulator [Paludibacteraceae bacterium]